MTQIKNVNIVPDGSINRVHVSQGDIGRQLQFNLYDGALAYTPTAGSTIKIQGTKPSGYGFSETCTWSGNVVTVATTEGMTQEYGYVPCELQITKNDDVLGTSNFILVVEKNPHPSNVTDGTVATAMQIEARMDALEAEMEQIEAGAGLTEAIKQALLLLASNVVYKTAEIGATVYDTLEDALFPPSALDSITAVYTQGTKTVYTIDTLADLTDDLVVTAHYDNGTTQTVTGYALSGSLTEGTSTITVTYSGKTTTFTVTVTALDTSLPTGYTSYDYISNYNPAFSSSTNRAQMVNTGLSGSYNTERYEQEIEFEIASDANSTGYALYGCRETTGEDLKARNIWISLADGQNRTSVQYNGVRRGTQNITLNEHYDYVTKDRKLIINGNVVASDMYDESYEPYTSGNIALWGCTTAGSNASALTCIMKLYAFKVRDLQTGAYVAYMIPAMNSSNVSGLYDIIRSNFYTAGTASKLKCENDE